MKRSQQPAAQKRLIERWTHPVGVEVDVRKDDGSVVRTKTRSEPWLLCGTAVIMVDGISGGYALERVSLAVPAVPSCGMCGKTGLRMSDMRIEGCARGRPRRSCALCVDCAGSIRSMMAPGALEAMP